METNKCKKKYKLKVKFNDKTLWNRYLFALGIISTIISFISFFVTADDIKMINRWQVAVVFFIFIILLFIAMWIKANRRRRAFLRINNTSVNVIEGDIWTQLKRRPKDRKGEISVIGVNEFFDDIVDNRIVSESSLHGQYIQQLSSKQKLGLLNKTIETDLILNKPGNKKADPNRKRGKKIRYELGSVVEFESYILAAFTKTNEDNEAWLSAEEYTNFWMRFWTNIDQIYAGRTINIPLMGAGLTRFKNGKPTKQELLEVMLWSLKISGFHITYADKCINFVIYPTDVAEIDFYHIQHNPSFK